MLNKYNQWLSLRHNQRFHDISTQYTHTCILAFQGEAYINSLEPIETPTNFQTLCWIMINIGMNSFEYSLISHSKKSIRVPLKELKLWLR